MLGEGGAPLSELQAAICRFLERDDRAVDLKDYRVVIDCLEGDFSAVAQCAKKARQHHRRFLDRPHMWHVDQFSRRPALRR